jgi:hypothetical protein
MHHLEPVADGDAVEVEVEHHQRQVHAVAQVRGSRQQEVQQQGEVALGEEVALLACTHWVVLGRWQLLDCHGMEKLTMQ